MPRKPAKKTFTSASSQKVNAKKAPITRSSKKVSQNDTNKNPSPTKNIESEDNDDFFDLNNISSSKPIEDFYS